MTRSSTASSARPGALGRRLHGHYRGLIERDTPHATEVRALLALSRGGENLGKLEAGKNSYKIAGPDPQVSSEVGIRTDYPTGRISS